MLDWNTVSDRTAFWDPVVTLSAVVRGLLRLCILCCSIMSVGVVVSWAGETAFLGGIINGDSNTAFVQHVPAGVDAIDLSSGKLLWHIANADKPLLVWKWKVVAMQKIDAKSLAVVLLDSRSAGSVVLKSESLTFPEWVDVDLRTSSSFAVVPKADNATLLLEITAKGDYIGGANPSDKIVEKYKHRASWTAMVDLLSGRVTQRETQEASDAAIDSVTNAVVVGDKRVQVTTDKIPVNATTEEVEKAIESVDAATGKLQWRTPIGRIVVQRKPQLPQ